MSPFLLVTAHPFVLAGLIQMENRTEVLNAMSPAERKLVSALLEHPELMGSDFADIKPRSDE